MEQQQQTDLVSLELWLVGMFGGVLGAYLWEPSSNIRASIVFCIALAFIPLLIWQLIQVQSSIVENLKQLQMIASGVAAVVLAVVALDVIFGMGVGFKLALVFIGYMVFAGITAWETVLYSLRKTLPIWLVGALLTGLLTGWIGDLSQDKMVNQTALIIVFSFIMSLMAMTGQLEAGVDSVLSTEPPGEGESAIH